MAPGILVSDDLVMDDAPSSSPNEDVNRKAALEDMFDDDDDDEEFLSSVASATDRQTFVLRAAPTILTVR
jgi:hypothetical protein